MAITTPTPRRMAPTAPRRSLTLMGSVAAIAITAGCNNAGEGALSGGALGAGTGAIIGSMFGHAGTGALVGVAGGALGGAIVGDQNERRDRRGGY